MNLNVFKVFPNLEALIVPRVAIAHFQLDRVQSRKEADHIDAIVDFLALQTGARAVTFHLLSAHRRFSRIPLNSPIGKH